MSRQPTHPGAILREDVLPDLGISKTKLAEALHISRQQLYGILDEKKSITPNIALRLGKFIGNGPDIWLRMQEAYDLHKERTKIKGVLNKISYYENSEYYQAV